MKRLWKSRTRKSKARRPYQLSIEPLEERLLMRLTALPDQALSTSTQPLDVRLGRIASDSFTDLAALGSDGKVTIALGNGSNAWRSVQTLNLGIGPANGLALASFGTDRFLDLVVQGPNSLSLARGDGTGHFTLTQTITPGALGTLAPACGGRVGMATGLLSGHTFTDLVTVAPGSNEVLVFPGNQNSKLGTPDRYPSGASQPDVVAIGDFMGDSLPDLAVGHLDGTVTFFQGLPGGKFLARPDLTVHGLGPVVDLATGDFDGDGDTEIAVNATNGVTLLNNHHQPPANPIPNGNFAAGLTGWTTTGPVIASGGFAQLREGDGLLTTLQKKLRRASRRPELVL